jgi:nucleotide-binding universal stress UspA family protein
MTLVVPYDDSDLSKAALVRAAQFDTVLQEDVIAVTVIPRGNEAYARERGWLGPTDPFDMDEITTYLRDSVQAIAPNAEFRYISGNKRPRSGEIAKKLRRFARDAGASIVFIGSENAGRVVNSMTVGKFVGSDRNYDTMIISHTGAATIEKFEDEMPTGDQPT